MVQRRAAVRGKERKKKKRKKRSSQWGGDNLEGESNNKIKNGKCSIGR